MSTKSTLASAISTTTSLLASPTKDPSFPFPGIPDTPESANRNCRLLGPFSLSIQFIMGFVVVGSLVLKRQREKPKRPWKIWLLDISKQMIGQLFVHSLNVLLSFLGSIASEGENNPCSLYFLNIAIDTTIGVLFIYFSMRYLTHYFTDVLGWPGFVSGQYTTVPTVLGRRKRRRTNDTSMMEDSVMSPGSESFSTHDQDASIHHTIQGTPAIESTPTPGSNSKKNRPRLSFFFRQLSLYLLSLLLMKIMVVLMFVLLPFLFDIGRWVLNLFGEHKKTQIFFVMAIFPLAMNTLQFWLIDSLLRHNPLTSIYKSEEDELNANDGVNGSGGRGEGYFDSTTSQGGGHWWQRGVSGVGDQQRGIASRNNEGSRARLMEDIGDDDHDNSSRSDDVHAYPPTPSANSSVGQLDTQAKSALEDHSKGEMKSRSQIGSGPVAPLEPIESSSPLVIASQEENEEEEEDAWDNWDEDRNKRTSVEH